MTEQAAALGFKNLTKDNWKSPDPFNDYFIKINLYTGEKLKITDEERAEEFLKIELIPSVPIEVRRQFEAARGAMLYGCFFYPLFALGADQLFRVAESAVTHKCLINALAKKSARYEVKLQKLKDANYLTATEHDEWEVFRKMRNELSHSKIQTVFPAFEAISILRNVTDKINRLFQTP